jgi:asparaginyl-tRNA synthetase
MTHTYIEDLAGHIGETVTIKGWVYNRRSSGKLHFLQVRDGTGIVQAVMFKGDFDDEVFKSCDNLPQETSLVVTGLVKEDKRSPSGVEVGVSGVEIVQVAEPFPITPKEHSTAFLMENRHLWLRSRKQHAVLRIRARIIKAIRDFFDNSGFVCMDTPIFTPAACEGTTTLFNVDYFDETAYLTQSGQLYGEAAAMAFGKIYCFGPTFRAEKSKTRRHLTEFWMVEPEVAFLQLDGIMDLAEECVSYVVAEVVRDRRTELDVLERDVARLERMIPPFPRMSYTDAVEFLKGKGHEIEWGDDFGAPEETVLGEESEKPVLIYGYPAAIKAFYMKRDPENEKVALGVDMIAPEGYGEIIGGGERSADLEYLRSQIARHELPEEAFRWYLDLRRYGSVPHGGFGLGLERTVAWICGTKHVRECIPFPRMLYKIYP